MSSLSVAGVARLDSIVLGEGFGALHPETLDVVATALETRLRPRAGPRRSEPE